MTNYQKSRRKLVICFSNETYKAPIWTNKQHLMSRLSKNDDFFVIYVDQGMSTRYIKKAINERDWRYFFFPFQMVNRNLVTFSPYFLPLLKGGVLKRMSWFFLYLMLRAYLFFSRFRSITYWIYQPQAWYFVKHLNSPEDQTILYDCVDEFSTQPFYKSSISRKRELEIIEEQLCRKADLVTTTSKALFDDKKVYNESTHYIHNVGDFDHFKLPSIPCESPHDWPDESRTKIVYAGVIDDYKIDLELVISGAKKLEKSHIFIFIGPMRVSNSSLERSFCKVQNILWLGSKQYLEVPNYLHQADVLWLPYNKTSHTNRVFPLKLFEYLATGKPVVSRDLASLQEYHKYMEVFESELQLLAILKSFETRAIDLMQKERVALASRNTWDSRLGNILKLI